MTTETFTVIGRSMFSDTVEYTETGFATIEDARFHARRMNDRDQELGEAISYSVVEDDDNA